MLCHIGEAYYTDRRSHGNLKNTTHLLFIPFDSRSRAQRYETYQLSAGQGINLTPPEVTANYTHDSLGEQVI